MQGLPFKNYSAKKLNSYELDQIKTLVNDDPVIQGRSEEFVQALQKIIGQTFYQDRP